jgi:hypothetical protein
MVNFYPPFLCPDVYKKQVRTRQYYGGMMQGLYVICVAGRA